MNQENTIKSMIPPRVFELIPPSIRDEWASCIVERFKENNRALYSAMGHWVFIPEEEMDDLMNKILCAAEQVHQDVQAQAQAQI